MEIRPRHIAPRVLEALEDTRVVVVQGARQVGKSTLVKEITRRHGGLLVTLDDPAARDLARIDPVDFLRQNPDGMLAIDEVQRVPELVLALKLNVDRDPRPGRFLITGSADLLKMPATGDSLAGRAQRIRLGGFSQGELGGHHETFIDRLLSGDRFLGHTSALGRHDYLLRAIAGGYPEALARPAGRRRQGWYDGYVESIIDRDAPDVSRLQQLGELRTILQMIAARTSGELNMAGLANDVGMPVSTIKPYLDLLETLYLITRVPAWSRNLSKRTVSRPKVSLLDTGLAAHLLNVSASGASPGTNPDVAGSLLEGFVTTELQRQLAWAEAIPRIFHYRDHDGAEIDLVLETPDGRVAGIEVKSGPGSAKDGRWLAHMRDKLGSRFIGGVVLTTGPQSLTFGDRISFTPMDVLWTT